MAHYHMGGVRVPRAPESRIKGLFAAGEAVGGTSGANRLSGNAITEALVFGEHVGRLAAARAEGIRPRRRVALAEQTIKELVRALPEPGTAGAGKGGGKSPAPVQAEHAAAHAGAGGAAPDGNGPQRRPGADPSDAPRGAPRLTLAAGVVPFNVDVQDWFELRNMLLVAEAVAQAALAREESRGAHQREDFPEYSQPVGAQPGGGPGPGGELLLRPEPVVTIGKEGATA